MKLINICTKWKNHLQFGTARSPVVLKKVGGQSYPIFGVTLAGVVILHVAKVSSTWSFFSQLEIKEQHYSTSLLQKKIILDKMQAIIV